MKKVAIYCRVSTEEQNPKHQETELKKISYQQNYMVYKVYTDVITGKSSKRPALMDLLKDAHDRKFNVVMVWKLDRMGRSIQHLIKIVNYFKSWNIDFICSTQQIDTTTPAGKFIFYIFAALAEFERELISERTKLGLKKAKNVGKRGPDKKERKKGGYYLRYQKKGTMDFSDLDLI